MGYRFSYSKLKVHLLFQNGTRTITRLIPFFVISSQTDLPPNTKLLRQVDGRLGFQEQY